MRSLKFVLVLALSILNVVGAADFWPFETFNGDGKTGHAYHAQMLSSSQIELLLAAQLNVGPVHLRRITEHQLSVLEGFPALPVRAANELLFLVVGADSLMSMAQQDLLQMISIYCQDNDAADCSLKILSQNSKDEDLHRIQTNWIGKHPGGLINVVRFGDNDIENSLVKRALDQQQITSSNGSLSSTKYSYCFNSEQACKSTSSDCSSSKQGKCIFDGECWKCSCKPGYAGGFCQLKDKISMFHTMVWVTIVMILATFAGISSLLAISSGY